MSGCVQIACSCGEVGRCESELGRHGNEQPALPAGTAFSETAAIRARGEPSAVTAFFKLLLRLSICFPHEVAQCSVLCGFQLPNGSRIVGLPGREATGRGVSAVNLLLTDEAARVSDELYNAVRW